MRQTMTATFLAVLVLFASLTGATPNAVAQGPPQIIVLGTAQDGGYPQAGCAKKCCSSAWDDPKLRRFVSSIALVDPETDERWLFDCTPDFREQLRLLDELSPSALASPLQGILPTHAHVGHYAGLLHLGREVMGADQIPVFCMPRMRYFLESNGPWSQLVELRQIAIQRISAGTEFPLNSRIRVIPILVPHRDEFSETVAFRIQGPNRSALYLPDIDKWDRWDVRIEDLIEEVDFAFLDATFFDDGELRGRDMAEIPHPFVVESLERFQKLNNQDRAKIHFIHLNHSNPALQSDSDARRLINSAGMQVAKQGSKHSL